MCGRRFVGHGAGFAPRKHHGEFFGLDVGKMNPKAQIVAGLSVIAPVALSGFALVLLAPGTWWIFTTYFWISFPAFGLLARGLAGLSEARPERGAPESGERELLRALREYGEVSPALAAMETSLSVAEAEGMLRKLAEGGHLEVVARGGGLHYALWESVPKGGDWRSIPMLEPMADGRAERRGGSR